MVCPVCSAEGEGTGVQGAGFRGQPGSKESDYKGLAAQGPWRTGRSPPELMSEVLTFGRLIPVISVREGGLHRNSIDNS